MAVSTTARAKAEPVPGGDAESPWHMPFAAWKAVLLRTWAQMGQDNIGLVAAGVAFYGFLALVPLLGALVLSYGFIAAPETVLKNMREMTSVVPADAAKLIGEQLMNVVKTSGSKKGIGLLIALGIALFGARNGAAAIITALNIAYEEKEKRGFVRLTLLALGITVAAVLVAIVAMVAVGALGHLESLIPWAPGVVVVVGKLLSYVMLLLVGAAGAATLYRYGPDRSQAVWAWITPGSLLAAVTWLLLTGGFGFYVAKFGSYNATYGSLGAVVVFLTWIYLSSYLLLIGAELNAELERQTSHDTTTGPPRPAGQRGAVVADHQVGQPKPPEAAESPVSDSPAGPEPGPEPEPEPSSRAPVVATHSVPLLGIRRAGLVPALLVTAGASALRREGRARAGIVLLSLGGAIAWLGRRPEK